MSKAFSSTRQLRQRGMTLVELLVALALGMLVVTIGMAALVFGRQGFDSVDSTTQLRDRERFVTNLLTRLVIQTGYQDLSSSVAGSREAAGLISGDPEPDIFGWNNAFYAIPADKILSESVKIVNGNRPSKCTVNDSSCKNGSDVLVIRYQGVSKTVGGTTSDNTMINCSGRGEAGSSTGDLNDRSISILHVSRDTSGEPSLSCVYYNATTGLWSTSSPIIESVESFQVLYGTDGVTPGAVATVAQDSIVDRWLRANELTVAGNFPATRANWRRVRAVRIGLVLRGPIGSAPDAANATLMPLGSLYTDSTNDVGTALSVGADRRLRTISTFTVHLRNELALK